MNSIWHEYIETTTWQKCFSVDLLLLSFNKSVNPTSYVTTWDGFFVINTHQFLEFCATCNSITEKQSLPLLWKRNCGKKFSSFIDVDCKHQRFHNSQCKMIWNSQKSKWKKRMSLPNEGCEKSKKKEDNLRVMLREI